MDNPTAGSSPIIPSGYPGLLSPHHEANSIIVNPLAEWQALALVAGQLLAMKVQPTGDIPAQAKGAVEAAIEVCAASIIATRRQELAQAVARQTAPAQPGDPRGWVDNLEGKRE